MPTRNDYEANSVTRSDSARVLKGEVRGGDIYSVRRRIGKDDRKQKPSKGQRRKRVICK